MRRRQSTNKNYLPLFFIRTPSHSVHTLVHTDIEFKPQADQAHLQLHAQLIKMVTLLNENRLIE